MRYTHFIAALILCVAAPVHAATITVTANAPDVLDGADGSCSLREAITNINDGAGTYADCVATGAAYGTSDTITLPAGTYTNTIAGGGEDLNATGDLDIMADVIFTGAGSGATAIDGGALDRVFHITGAFTVSISGVTITNGAEAGGGLYNGGGAVTLTNVIIDGNASGGNGGGVYNNSGTINFTDSTISGNTATSIGGGVFNTIGASITFTNVTISGNSVNTNGGGVYNAFGTVALASSTVSGNSATTNGGGIFNVFGGSFTVTNSTISNNSAGSNGGGVYNNTNAMSITGSTFTGNSSDIGGAVYSVGGITLTNTTISGNTAHSLVGGGIYNSFTATINNCSITNNSGSGIYHAAGTTTISNTIVANQAADWDCSPGGSVTSAGYNLDSQGVCGLTQLTDIPNGAPNLDALADNGGPTWTHALLAGSDAIDAGDCAGGTVTDDQRGESRPRGIACDIGAYEAPPRAYAGDSATGSGQITASFTGGGDGCAFTTSAFIPVSAVAADPPAGVLFPHGLFDFTLGGCEEASTVEIMVTYPEALPADTQYWKYGPTADDETYHWYVIPAVFDGNTVTFSITDGGLGDDDLTPNGTIVDQGGPGVPGDAIPTLSQWALLLLMLLLTGLGLRRMCLAPPRV